MACPQNIQLDFTVICCTLIAVLVSGCSSRNKDGLIPVAGSVIYAGQPLTTGTVSFRPDASLGNTSLHHPTGSIDAQGRYRLYTAGKVGAPPGSYKVVVFASEQIQPSAKVHPGLPKSLIPLKYNQAGRTPLAVEVKPAAGADAYDLRLEK